MKKQYARDMVEDLLSMDRPNVVVELANGTKLPIENYYHGADSKGKMIIILKAKGSNKIR